MLNALNTVEAPENDCSFQKIKVEWTYKISCGVCNKAYQVRLDTDVYKRKNTLLHASHVFQRHNHIFVTQRGLF